MQSRLAWLPCLALGACAGPGTPPGATGATAPQAAPDTGEGPLPAAAEYVAPPRPGGVLGGPDSVALGHEIAGALRERGDSADADGALVGAASSLLEDAVAGHAPSLIAGQTAASRLGFVGTIPTGFVFHLDHPEFGWREVLAGLPRNLPINRYGVRVSAGARLAAVVFGAVEVVLLPFPRHLSPGGTVHLQGEVGSRFSSAQIHVTRPDGAIQQTVTRGRQIETSFTCPAPGRYQLEVMGDGPMGPMVVVNVPLFVGLAEPTGSEPRPPVIVDPPAVEERMLTLLNEERVRAGLTALVADSELRALAVGHSEDMVRARFFGHVSPTTGTLLDRKRRAHLRARVVGENLALAPDADNGHWQLMESPAHRANMLNPLFTHVGIAAVPDPATRSLAVTLVFARRVPLPAARPVAAEAELRAQAARARKGLAPIAIDPGLQAAAAAGAAALEGGAAKDTALAAAAAELQRSAHLRQEPREGVCSKIVELFELDDIEERPFLASPTLRSVGLAVALSGDAAARRLWLVSLYAGPPCN